MSFKLIKALFGQGVEKWENRKNLTFSYVCLVEGEKVKRLKKKKKLFSLVEKKYERI